MALNIQFQFIGFLAMVCAGCVGPKSALFPPAAGEPTCTVYAVNHGWHTGLVIRRSDIPTHLWPSTTDFPKATWLEVGWGEDGFYRAQKVTVGLTLKALFWSNPSVLHLVGFSEPAEVYFPSEEIVRIELSTRGFEEMCRFVGGRYQIQTSGEGIFLEPGLYGESRFYRATGKYYFPKTCNLWTARALRAGGCPITPAYAVTSRNVIMQCSEFGTVVRRRPFLSAPKREGNR